MPFNLLVVDDDPIFRLGVAEMLNRNENFSVIGQESLDSILSRSIAPAPDLIFIDPVPYLSIVPDWSLVAQIQRLYPTSKIIIITMPLDSNTKLIGQRMGLAGYIPKKTSFEEIVSISLSISRGEFYWPSSALLVPVNYPNKKKTHWLIRSARSGLNQIDDNIEMIRERLSQSRLSEFDRFYWRGRKRELSTAAWLIKKLLPVEVTPIEGADNVNYALPESVISSEELPILSRYRPLTSSVVFEDTLAQIRSPLTNVTEIPLEIEVLQANAQKELLYITFTQIRQTIDDLRFLELSADEIVVRKNRLLGDIWEKSTRNFLDNYFIDKFDTLFLEQDIIQKEILNKIPFVNDLLNYLVLGDNLLIDGVEYTYNEPETIERAKILLQNLINTVANAVMIIILNNFYDNEYVKNKIFKPDFRVARKLALFRNNLSWKYTQDKYFREPKLIFESQQRLFYYDQYKIKKLLIYTPREEELKQLSGLRWLVTIALELRDALSPRFRVIFSVVGKGLVYFLIQVIGRGIGLIGRGILQGVGDGFGKTVVENRPRGDKMP